MGRNPSVAETAVRLYPSGRATIANNVRGPVFGPNGDMSIDRAHRAAALFPNPTNSSKRHAQIPVSVSSIKVITGWLRIRPTGGGYISGAE